MVAAHRHDTESVFELRGDDLAHLVDGISHSVMRPLAGLT
jgi:hypothetical protein